MSAEVAPRRGFLRRLAGLAGFSAAASSASAQTGNGAGGDFQFLPRYARGQNYRSLKQSSFDRTGGNADSWPIQPGGTRELFAAEGPGVISHIWFTIAADSPNHLKEIVIRIYWDGNSKPSVEAPVGDFFGLNLGQYFVYQSAFLNCSSVKALNCYFAGRRAWWSRMKGRRGWAPSIRISIINWSPHCRSALSTSTLSTGRPRRTSPPSSPLERPS